MSDFGAMLLITYSPPDGTEHVAYEDWLRKYDCPFFNSVPGIVEYTNWKIVEARGRPLPFTHFDLLGLTGIEAVDSVWNNPELQAFAAYFRSTWKVVPAHVYVAARTVAVMQSRTKHIVLSLHRQSSDAHRRGFDAWEIVRSVREHTPRFDSFALRFLSRSSDFFDFAPRSADETILLGACIASPDSVAEKPQR